MSTPYQYKINERIVTQINPENPDNVMSAWRTSDVAKEFFGDGKIELGVLPPVVRWLAPDFSAIIIERPPCVQTINFKPVSKSDHHTAPEFYSIPLPWQVYYMHIGLAEQQDGSYKLTPNDFRIFFRPNQIWSPDDQLYRPWTPNIWTNEGTVCRDIDTVKASSEATTLSEMLNIEIAGYWSSEFNTDIPDFQRGAPAELRYDLDGIRLVDTAHDKPGYRNYFNHMSRFSTEQLLDLKYVPLGTTVEQLIRPAVDALRYNHGNLRVYFNTIVGPTVPRLTPEQIEFEQNRKSRPRLRIDDSVRENILSNSVRENILQQAGTRRWTNSYTTVSTPINFETTGISFGYMAENSPEVASDVEYASAAADFNYDEVAELSEEQLDVMVTNMAASGALDIPVLSPEAEAALIQELEADGYEYPEDDEVED